MGKNGQSPNCLDSCPGFRFPNLRNNGQPIIPAMQSKRVAVFACVLLSAPYLFGQEFDFNRDIRPILSDKCYFCHGPDENSREAGLRLDTATGSKDAIESGYLIERIFSDDPDEIMPPPDAKHGLSSAEKNILKSMDRKRSGLR